MPETQIPKKKGDIYTCYVCKGVFATTISKEEAVADHELLFNTEYNESEIETVCDECFKKITRIAQ